LVTLRDIPQSPLGTENLSKKGVGAVNDPSVAVQDTSSQRYIVGKRYFVSMVSGIVILGIFMILLVVSGTYITLSSNSFGMPLTITSEHFVDLVLLGLFELIKILFGFAVVYSLRHPYTSSIISAECSEGESMDEGLGLKSYEDLSPTIHEPAA